MRARCVEGTPSFWPSPGTMLPVPPTWRLSTPSFVTLMEVSSHWHDWLHHWSLVIDSTSAPLPSLEGEPAISNPLIMVGSSFNQLPFLGAFHKSPYEHKGRVVGRRLLWIPKDTFLLCSSYFKYYNERCSYCSNYLVLRDLGTTSHEQVWRPNIWFTLYITIPQVIIRGHLRAWLPQQNT